MCYMIMFTRHYANSPKLSTSCTSYMLSWSYLQRPLGKFSQTVDHTARVPWLQDTVHMLPKLSINGSHVLYDHIYKILYKFSHIFDHAVRMTCCHYHTYKTPYKFSQTFNYTLLVTYCHNYTLTKHYTNSPKLSFIIWE